MAEPIFDATTEKVYNELPQHYRDRDIMQDYQLKRYLAGLLSSQNDVNGIIDRLMYTPPEEGGLITDTSDLVNPLTADAGWLKWLGQLFGTTIRGEVTEGTRNEIIQASGFKAGTTDSLIAAAQSVLVGSKKVRIIKHADETWQPTDRGTGGPWDLLVMTLQSETLKNLLAPALAKTLTPSVWVDYYKSFGYDPEEVYREIVEQPGVYQNRAYAFSLKDIDWKASATIDTGYGSGGFGQTSFGVSSDKTSDLLFTSREGFDVVPTDSYQFLTSLGLKQESVDEKISSMGFQFYDADGNVIKNAQTKNFYPDPSHEYGIAPFSSAPANATVSVDTSKAHSGLQSLKTVNTSTQVDTNYYPDPSHEYGLAPMSASPSSGSGTLALTTAQKHSGNQAIAYTNTTPKIVGATNLATRPNPVGVISGAGWASNNVANWIMTPVQDVVRRPGTWSVKGTLGSGGIGLNSTLSMYSIGLASNAVNTDRIAMVAGQTYAMSFWMRASYANFRYQLTGNFFDESGTQVGGNVTAGVTSVTAPANTWVRGTATLTVPAGATRFRPALQMYLAGPADVTTGSEQVWVTDFQAELGGTATPYFDGSMAASGTTSYQWTGTANASTSQMLIPGTENTYKTSSTLSVTPASIGLNVGDQITFSCWVYIPSGATTYSYIMRLNGTGATGTNIRSTGLPRDQWTYVTATWTVADANGTLSVTIYGPSMTGDVMYFDDFGLSTGAQAVDFNGTTPKDNLSSYAWTGIAGASSSTRTSLGTVITTNLITEPSFEYGGTAGLATTGARSVANVTTEAHRGTHSLKLVNLTGNGGVAGVFWGSVSTSAASLGFVNGDQVTVGAWVKQLSTDPNGNIVLAAYGASGSNVTDTTTTTNQWVFLTTTKTITDATQPLYAAVYLPTVVNATVYVDDLSVTKGSAPADFSGDTPNTVVGTKYMWSGVAGQSTSYKYNPVRAIAYITATSIGNPASFGLAAGDKITMSLWTYIPSSSDPYAAAGYLFSLSGAGVASAAYGYATDARDDWVRISVTATVGDPNGSLIPHLYGGYQSGDIIWFDDFMINKGSEPIDDFNGDTLALEDGPDGPVTFYWDGVPGASSSTVEKEVFSTPIDVKPTIVNTDVVSHNLIKSTKYFNYKAAGSNPSAITVSNFGKYSGGDVIRATINNISATSDFGLSVNQLNGMQAIPSGTTFVFSLDYFGDVSASIDGLKVVFNDDAAGDNTAADFDYNTPSFVTLTKGRWHTRHWVATVKPNRTITSMCVLAQSSVNQSQGAYIDTANWMIEEGNTANPYFNGDTPQDSLYTYQWAGIPGDSITNKILTSVAKQNVVDMEQYSTRFAAPASAATAKVFVRMLGFSGRDTFYIAQPAVREETDETWVPVTADPLQAIKDKGVKPAGIILHWLPIVSDWDTITANGTRTWDDIRVTWTQLEELG